VSSIDRLRLDGRGLIPGRRNDDIFFFVTAFKPTLGLTQPPVRRVWRVKWPQREADHSLPSSAGVKNVWSYTCTPPIRFHGVVLN
jgi:hypothetical protein